jgi:hypothetical protein
MIIFVKALGEGAGIPFIFKGLQDKHDVFTKLVLAF